MAVRINHKRGDTLSLACARRDAAGAAVDLTGYTITSQVRRFGTSFSDDLTVTITGALAGTFSLFATSDVTALWPVTLLSCDIQFNSGIDILSSETFEIDVLLDVTQ